MNFWRNNRIDEPFEMPVEEVARLYFESTWAVNPWPLERRVRAFLTDTDGPISAVWDQDDPDFDKLITLVVQQDSA